MIEVDPDTLRRRLPAFTSELPPEQWPQLCSASEKFLGYYGVDFRGQFEGLNQSMQTLPWGSGEVVVYSWLPASAQGTVFLVHGYFDHTSLYKHGIRWWLENNYNVIAFDLPGHGLSSGNRACVESFDYYSDAFQTLLDNMNALQRPFVTMGQSTGCAVIMNTLLDEKFKISSDFFSQKVLLAPLVRSSGWATLQWVYAVAKPFLKSVPRGFATNCQNPEFLEFLKHKDPLQAKKVSVVWLGAMKAWVEKCKKMPVTDEEFIVIQGDKDVTVDFVYNTKEIMRICPRSKLHMIEGLNHHVVNETPVLREKVFSIIGQNLK